MRSRPRRSVTPVRLSASLLAWLLLLSGGTVLLSGGPLTPMTVSAQGEGDQTLKLQADYPPWMTLQGDPGHGGATGFASAHEMSLPESRFAWDYPAPIYSDPVAGHGMVFGGSLDFGVTAASLVTGKVVWQAPLDGLALSAPTLDENGRLFVELADPNNNFMASLWALDAFTGQVLWTFGASTMGGTPVMANHTLFTFTAEGLIALEPATGRLLWDFPLDLPAYGISPSVARGLVLVVDGEVLHALDLQDGNEVWNQTVGAVTSAAAPQLTVAQGLVFVRTDEQMNLTALYLSNGTRKWSVGASGGRFFANNVAVAPGLLYTYHRSEATGPALLAVDLKDGQISWGAGLQVQGESLSSPIATPRGVLALMEDGTVLHYNTSSSNTSSTYITAASGLPGTYTRSLLILTADRLLVATQEGLYAFGTPYEPARPNDWQPAGDNRSISEKFYDFINSDQGLMTAAFIGGLVVGISLSRKKIMGLRQRANRLQEWVRHLSEQRHARAEEQHHEAEGQSAAATGLGTTKEERSPPTRAVVVCGAGPLTGAEKRALKEAYLIAADGGANALHHLNRPPDLLIGDMDSISPEARAWCQELGVPEEKFPGEKDATDGQLAVETALNLGFDHLEMVGALGGRTDHSYANMGLLELIANEGAFGQIVGPDIDIFPVTPDSPLTQATIPGRTVSLMPLSERITDIRSKGLRYPLHGTTMLRAHTLGVSNETVDSTIQVKVGSGTLLVGINRPPE